jgi:hypothetical protein
MRWPDTETSWIVPAALPIELFFFQRVFKRLCEQREERFVDYADDPPDDLPPRQPIKAEDLEKKVIALAEFQRAMVRLFRFLHDDREFNAKSFDSNNDGSVGWYEFCSVWKKRKIKATLSLAERIFLTLEDSERSIVGKIVSVLVFIAIIISTLGFILSTLPSMRVQCPPKFVFDTDGRLSLNPEFDEACRPQARPVFQQIDFACVMFFSVEYGTRLVLSAWMRSEIVDRDKMVLLEWMVTDEVVYRPHPLKRVMKFFFNWSNLIDLAAIMPGLLIGVVKSEDGEDSPVMKMLRLTRVIRAFRLGRRFEAVIIIIRSLNKSLRALKVLVLNLFLNMIIFGSLMYFVEQGDWYPEQGDFMRFEDNEWRHSTQQWHEVKMTSPFNSIPTCFWWAIVTATTVGYGDWHTPRTAMGKVVAGVFMVWSLVVLALPIGVIGSNFSDVWREYDREKSEEEDNRIQELNMLKKSVAWGDPLYFSRRVLIEIWQDIGSVVGTKLAPHESESEFLGEADCELEIDPVKKVCNKREKVALVQNFDKGRRQVKGFLSFEYTWIPQQRKAKTPDTLLDGQLTLTKLAAEDLISIDWMGGSQDPQMTVQYCKVIAHPTSPNEDGILGPVAERVGMSDADAKDKVVTFNMHWTKEMADKAEEISMRKSVVPRPPKQVTSDESAARVQEDMLMNVVPDLQGELRLIRDAVPQLKADIASVRGDVRTILETLRRRAAGDDAVGSFVRSVESR